MTRRMLPWTVVALGFAALLAAQRPIAADQQASAAIRIDPDDLAGGL